MRKYSLLIPAIALAAMPAATAATVLIDWSTANDISGVADTNGNFWNSLGANGIGSDVSATVLKNSATNANTAWSVSTDLTGNTGNNTGAGIGGTAINGPVGATIPFNTTGTNRPTVDGMFANYNANGTALITFTGLALNTQYDFSAIGGRASGGSDGFIKVITGTAGAGGADIDLIDSDDFLDTFSLLNDGTIRNFSVTSNGSGSIAFRFFEGQNDIDGGTSATFNALSMTQIPEPSAALLGGLGLLALLRRRR